MKVDKYSELRREVDDILRKYGIYDSKKVEASNAKVDLTTLLIENRYNEELTNAVEKELECIIGKDYLRLIAEDLKITKKDLEGGTEPKVLFKNDLLFIPEEFKHDEVEWAFAYFLNYMNVTIKSINHHHPLENQGVFIVRCGYEGRPMRLIIDYTGKSDFSGKIEDGKITSLKYGAAGQII